ncbi:MAG: FHA domain-containing protein [Candidatus Brocadiia bacterium]
MVRLIITTAEESRVLESEETPLTIGRSSANAVRITDDQSSRQHCRIARGEGGHTLTDLASRNGTYLNGQLVDESPLRHGDQIRIGTTVITFQLPDQQEAPAGQAQGAAQPQPHEQAEPPEALRLAFVAGINKGQSEVVGQKITTIGRSRSNDLVVPDRGVSNRHAEIRQSPEGFVLVDAGSRNGTYLNGRLVLREAIGPGDQIRMGKTLIQVRPAEAEEEPVDETAEEAVPAAFADEATSGELEAVGAPGWLRIGVPVVLVVGVSAGAVFIFKDRLASWIFNSGDQAPSGLLGEKGAFDSAEARQAWQPGPRTEGRFVEGRLELSLPAAGAPGELASYALAEPLPVTPRKAYRVAARVTSDDLGGGFAGLAATWVGAEDWGPQAAVLVRADAATGAAEATLAPPAWAASLHLACVAGGRRGTVAFDDVSVLDTGHSRPLPRLRAGPLALAADTPVLFSVAHQEARLFGGAGFVVDPGGEGATVRQPRAEVATDYQDFARAASERYECRTRALLPPDDVPLHVHQVLRVAGERVVVHYRAWTDSKARVAFAGLELPGPADALARMDVRTTSGFFQPSGGGDFDVDQAQGVAWDLGAGMVFLDTPGPMAVQGRGRGPAGVCRVGWRDVELGPERPLELEVALFATAAGEEVLVQRKCEAAAQAAREKRFGPAIALYQALLEAYPHRRRVVELARARLDELRGQALEASQAALRRLERAVLTGEEAHFDAARAALDSMGAALQGTPHEPRIEDALRRCQQERQAARQRRQEREAARLLGIAQRHHHAAQPHIVRLCCQELLDRFPDTPAAAEARALLAGLERPVAVPDDD